MDHPVWSLHVRVGEEGTSRRRKMSADRHPAIFRLMAIGVKRVMATLASIQSFDRATVNAMRCPSRRQCHTAVRAHRRRAAVVSHQSIHSCLTAA